MLAFCDNTNEALPGMLRPGNAGSNTAADHITVVDAALAQIPDDYRHGYPILFRFHGAGASKALLTHIDRCLTAACTANSPSAGPSHPANTPPSRPCPNAPRPTRSTSTATRASPRRSPNSPAYCRLPCSPTTRPGCRSSPAANNPTPGAQLNLIEEADGWGYTCLATDTAVGQHAWLDARHRSHARVQDRIRTGKDTGLGRFPSRQFAINQAWLACVLTAIDLLAWTQTILLHDQPALARAEPKTLRYRLLHTAARLVHGGRKLRLKIDRNWRWADTLAAAFHRLHALPTPRT